jgi:hypothetical protein
VNFSLANLSFNATNPTVVNSVTMREDEFIRQYCGHLPVSIFIVFALAWACFFALQVAGNRRWVTGEQYAEYSERLIRGYIFLGCIALVYLGIMTFGGR